MLEHRLERLGIAVAHEVEVAARDLESLHVADAPHAEQQALERAQPAAVGVGPGARAAAGALRQKPPRDVQHVHVRAALEGRREPVELVARLEHGHVERLAVVADEPGRSPHEPVHFVEQRSLVLVAAAGSTGGCGSRAARSTRIRPGTRRCPRHRPARWSRDRRTAAGLGVPSTRRRAPADERQLRLRRQRESAHVADTNRPVAVVRRVEAIDPTTARPARRFDDVAIERFGDGVADSPFENSVRGLQFDAVRTVLTHEVRRPSPGRGAARAGSRAAGDSRCALIADAVRGGDRESREPPVWPRFRSRPPDRRTPDIRDRTGS